MNILVTGGAGFIGSHLCSKLLEQGSKVIAVDNLITGSKANIQEFKSNSNFKFITADATKEFSVKEKIDYIFHFASPASPIDYQAYPIETLLVNSVGTKNCLDLARRDNAKIMFASTSEIYGDPKEHPQKETYWGNVNPRGVRSCYDEAKRFGESLVLSYQRKYQTKTVTIRIFNTYGPKMQKDDGRVISNFVNQALENKAITIYGTGKQTRSFCYIDDLIEGIIAVMFNNKTQGEVYNLGNPEEYSILNIANKIINLTGSKSQIIFNCLPEDDPKRRKPDISKIKKATGWKPKTKLDEGLKKTIEYFKNIK